MNPYFTDNNDRLDNRLKSIMAKKEAFLIDSMQEVLIWAANRALDLHDELEGGTHNTHLEIGDSYGWALVHDGIIVSMDVTATQANVGNATKALQEEAMNCPMGWCGVVLAGMLVNGGLSYYSYRFEELVLRTLAGETESNYMKTLRKIKFTR